ncbi:MAG: iron chelate uptake ABC transporter family permease subunit [Thermoflexaceae bacterium]|nr:iron chelate uptake ABC transporter family permease subunit [Thermoflexaceae bacterium]
MTYDLKGSLDYALELRGRKVAGMAIVGFAVAYSSVLFHTATHNRILTPSLMGFDSLYILIQTLAAYFLGTTTFLLIDVRLRFGIEVVAMLAFAALLYRWLLGRGGRDVYVLVLVGIIMGTMFSSLTELVMRMIDPNEFSRLQDRLFASFSTINQDLLAVSAIAVAATTIISWPMLNRLDVVALGEEHATNLGVDHQRLVSRSLFVVAVLVSVSTALVGPVAFLGLLVANLAYQLTGTFRHRYTVPAAGLLGMIALIGGQFVLQEILEFKTRLSIIISFIGGIYFIFLLYREARK